VTERLLAADELPVEERSVQLARLRAGEAGSLESLYRFLGDPRLVRRKQWRVVTPFKASADVLLEPRRTRELVREAVQLTNLIEERLENRVIERHSQLDHRRFVL
jgi:hypothetical protein